MSGGKIDIIEIFNSIQGEGMFVGTPMTFIRLKNCNLRCEFCDTRPWEKESSRMTTDEILQACCLLSEGLLPHVCITGGEPLLEPLLEDLLWGLRSRGVSEMHIESNGSDDVWKHGLVEYWPTGSVSITLSPKTPEWSLKRMYDSSLADLVTDIKILVDENGPRYPLEQFKDWHGGIYLQPISDPSLSMIGEFGYLKEQYELLKPWLFRFPFCSMSLQIHKLLGIR
jgi:organic radical activating enzyme